MQPTLPSIGDAFPQRAHAKPVVKWVGGKTDMVPLLSNTVYRHLQRTGGIFVEPFLGGAALALDLGLPKMRLSDRCEPLINCYEWVRKAPSQVLWLLEQYVTRGVDEAAYTAIRNEAPRSHMQAAARFIYLNKVCYNGVWRVNRHGKMNVPRGRSTSGTFKFPSHEDLKQFNFALKGATLSCTSFEQPVRNAPPGAFIYADPPYFGAYDDYTEHGFSVDDQAKLAALLRDASTRDVAVVASNADTPEIREMYSWAYVTEVAEAHSVNCDTSKRQRVGCLLIASSSDLLVAA